MSIDSSGARSLIDFFRNCSRGFVVALAATMFGASTADGAEQQRPADSDASATGESERSGMIAFLAADTEQRLPERFQLASHEFLFRAIPQQSVSTQFSISLVTFPSPVETPHVNNNTVHCEYFRPATPGKHPGVIVLHILGGDFDLARLFCRTLAANDCGALFLKMPYYGPRRQPDSPARMISLDPQETVRGMTQAILDIRRGRAWLAAQDEIDPEQTGIMGISLGGITSALAITAEPRFRKACLLLAGGNIGEVAWESREVRGLRERWESQGGTRESLIETLRCVDPVTYAANARDCQVLMLNASRDEVVPKTCTESLWESLGRPKIVWWNAGHYSAMAHIFEGLSHATRFFQPDASRP